MIYLICKQAIHNISKSILIDYIPTQRNTEMKESFIFRIWFTISHEFPPQPGSDVVQCPFAAMSLHHIPRSSSISVTKRHH